MGSKENMLGDCLSTGCGWKCCKYGAEGILLLPKEYEKIEEGKAEHLKMINDDYFGGKIVRCTAKNTANCDNGYKPIQCSVYPFWIKNGDVVSSLRCPMPKKKMKKHQAEAVVKLIEYNEKVNIKEFLKKAKVNNYEKFD